MPCIAPTYRLLLIAASLRHLLRAAVVTQGAEAGHGITGLQPNLLRMPVAAGGSPVQVAPHVPLLRVSGDQEGAKAAHSNNTAHSERDAAEGLHAAGRRQERLCGLCWPHKHQSSHSGGRSGVCGLSPGRIAAASTRLARNSPRARYPAARECWPLRTLHGLHRSQGIAMLAVAAVSTGEPLSCFLCVLVCG